MFSPDVCALDENRTGVIKFGNLETGFGPDYLFHHLTTASYNAVDCGFLEIPSLLRWLLLDLRSSVLGSAW